MSFLYFLSVRAYGLLVRAAAPFNKKARLWVNGRKEQIPQIQKTNETWPVVWFHCASYGEFEQCRLIIEHVRKYRSEHKVLLTFFSPSGYEQIKNEDVADYIYYLPEENSRNIKQLLESFNITHAVFVRYEFWYGYMIELFNRGIPLTFVSASFRTDQVFFRPYGVWFRKQLARVSKFFVQEESSFRLLESLNINQVVVSGDTRFDRVLLTRENNEELPLVKSFVGEHRVVIFGSAWEKETEYFNHLVNQIPKGWKIIYAPHEIDQKALNKLETQFGGDAVQYSQLAPSSSDKKVLIVNTVGHLSRMYKYCDIAIVGGGFNDGIHNILEPMVFGLPVFFGPNHASFWEAKASINQGLNVEYHSYNELHIELNQWFTNTQKLEQHKSRALDFIVNGAGATQTVVSYLLKELK